MAVNNLEEEEVVGLGFCFVFFLCLIYLVLETVVWKEGTVAGMMDTCDSAALRGEPGGGFCRGGRS